MMTPGRLTEGTKKAREGREARRGKWLLSTVPLLLTVLLLLSSLLLLPSFVVVVVGLHQLFFIRVLCPVVLRYDPPVCFRQSQS